MSQQLKAFCESEVRGLPALPIGTKCLIDHNTSEGILWSLHQSGEPSERTALDTGVAGWEGPRR